MERQCLDILLRGNQPVVLFTARGLPGLGLGKGVRRPVKVLRGKLGDIKRLRVGKYRILFDDDNEVMSVYEVKHRREAYSD
jgi:mRNA-degrading endonuclease RelE of RelBE toxin-antitoxin system